MIFFLGAFSHILLSNFFVSTAPVPFFLIRNYRNIQEKKCEAAYYVISSLTAETARTNHTLVINISLIYLAFHRCCRPNRRFLESIIKVPIQTQFLKMFYVCSPEICSFLTTRIHITHRILTISLFLKSTS